jgi:hypothetical protein
MRGVLSGALKAWELARLIAMMATENTMVRVRRR